ncbi:hypothetical protein [Shewanella baltica]|uniref:hypothetical protein n=1 Tax=Shewanella baltica TaxID=62322 RepID=UPI0039B0A5C2
MPDKHLYAEDFLEQHKVEEINVVALYHDGKFEELDSVIICKDSNGRTTAIFGDDNWDCFPFSRKKVLNNLSFIDLPETSELMRELKLLSYGWLFNKSPKKIKATSFSGIRGRVSSIKIAYRFLAENRYTSLKALSKPTVWEAFKEYLTNNEYAKETLMHCFVAINKVIEYATWHKIPLGFTRKLESQKLAHDLNSIEQQQTFVIPERLCDAIYGKAISLIEEASPYQELIAKTENALQDNYIEAKRILDDKIKNGSTFAFMLSNGKIDSRKYLTAISDNQPRDLKDIIAPLAQKLPNIPLKHGKDFQRYLGQLITSSYIVCGGFSGMRDSELDKLTPNSYYKDSFEGRDYHMLQSHTFKLREKRETWVTASSSKTAIKLMGVLTERWRQETKYPSEKYANSIWLNQIYRSIPPVLITGWNQRLMRFCTHFNFIVTESYFQECLDSNPNSQEKIRKIVKVGKPWPLKTHQFRRTLAFYCIKNRFGTLVALKQQFKHIYLAMTEWYTNGGKMARLMGLIVDENVRRLLNDINTETTANKIFKQWHSDEKLSGTHGKAIIKMRGDVPTIYSSWDVIYKAVKDGKLTLHGSLHSYCKSGYDCDMDGVVMPQFCVDCGSGSSIIDEQQAKWWQKKHRSLVAYMELGENISVSERSHYITQVRAAENVMKDFDMEFTPFEAELKVIEL